MPVTRGSIGTVTIANGTSLSGAIEIGPASKVSLRLPTMTNAAITFQGSADGVTFVDLYDSTMTEATIAASTGNRCVPCPAAVAACQFIKVRSGTSATPINQGADRIVTVMVA